jgi:hypothetical protein
MTLERLSNKVTETLDFQIDLRETFKQGTKVTNHLQSVWFDRRNTFLTGGLSLANHDLRETFKQGKHRNLRLSNKVTETLGFQTR